jgi:hypothetical protein
MADRNLIRHRCALGRYRFVARATEFARRLLVDAQRVVEPEETPLDGDGRAFSRGALSNLAASASRSAPFLRTNAPRRCHRATGARAIFVRIADSRVDLAAFSPHRLSAQARGN